VPKHASTSATALLCCTHTFRPVLQGSRPHYCINKSVIRTGNIDGECEKLLKEEERGCLYKKAAATITHGLVRVGSNSLSSCNSVENLLNRL
jgi:hypothetical protein